MSLETIIGNDIIDWQTAKTQHQKLRKRCLDKLFTSSEIDYIQSSKDAMFAFWHLWSVKETAYKAWQRQVNSKPIFNPKRFECQHISIENTTLSKANFFCDVETVFTSKYIYSECKSKALETQIFSSKHDFFQWFKPIKALGWEIEKDKNNIPNLCHIRKSMTLPISISHDVKFWSIAFKRDFLIDSRMKLYSDLP